MEDNPKKKKPTKRVEEEKTTTATVDTQSHFSKVPDLYGDSYKISEKDVLKETNNSIPTNLFDYYPQSIDNEGIILYLFQCLIIVLEIHCQEVELSSQNDQDEAINKEEDWHDIEDYEEKSYGSEEKYESILYNLNS